MPREPLEAIVLVGGQGTRLRPLTLSAPKPLLPTAGVPFLVHLLTRAAAGGVTHVVLATCYKAEMFAAVLGDGGEFGLSIDYVQEEQPLDTAGGIRNAARSLRGSGPADPVVVLNSDILSGHDLTAPTMLLVGTEATGLSSGWREACDRMVRIPIGGAASSLNAATATGIALYEAARQRRPG